MKPDLENLFATAAQTTADDIPQVLGLLRELEVILLQRLYSPPETTCGVSQQEQLLNVEQAAERLKVSTDYLYRHWHTLPFARKLAFGLRFSESALNAYIRNGHK